MNYTDNHVTDMQWLPKTMSVKVIIKRIIRTIFLIISAALVLVASYVFLTYRWADSTWDNLTFTEIIYHLKGNLEGAAEDMVNQHIFQCAVPAVIITAVFVAVIILLRKRHITVAFMKGGAAALSIIVLANTVSSFWEGVGISEYLESRSTYSSFIDENYVDPASVELTFPEEKRNLIYIFLESTENTFSSTEYGGAFDDNDISELTQISLANENFSGSDSLLDGGVPMVGGTWTMAALFSQTSGLPLLTTLENNEMSGQDEFFPGATTLGDILDEAGYNQVFLCGSEASFGGRELYFTTHGNYEIRDLYYYTGNGTLPEDYYVWWGYEDLYLFENAKTELEALAAQDEPFNLTMLTVDTHFEDGYVCDLCEDETDNQYSNVYRCASRQVAEFLEWCETQDWYENTTIIISGDHLTMDSDFCEAVSDDYTRTVYTTIINGAAERQTDTYREYSTLDMFPTTLAALGVDIPGDKLALGTNLYSASSTLLEIYGYSEFNSGLSSKSELMDNLTAGISGYSCTIEMLEYDEISSTLQFIISDITGLDDNGINKVNAYVSDEDGNEKTIGAENQDDGTYLVTVNFAKFDYKEGTYSIVFKARNADTPHGGTYVIGSKSITISSSGVSEESLIGFKISDLDYSTGTFTISYAKTDMSNIVDVAFAVWKEDDQSDLKWYSSTYSENGTYAAEVDMFDYAINDDSFTIHV